jgi:hypothetical protein
LPDYDRCATYPTTGEAPPILDAAKKGAQQAAEEEARRKAAEGVKKILNLRASGVLVVKDHRARGAGEWEDAVEGARAWNADEETVVTAVLRDATVVRFVDGKAGLSPQERPRRTLVRRASSQGFESLNARLQWWFAPRNLIYERNRG